MSRNQNTNSYLPCQTFIMCGTCSYHQRCIYIHDPRIKYDENYYKFTRRKNSPSNDTDIWCWPYDLSNNIKCTKYYNIPKPLIQHDIKYSEIYSLWNNFIDVCYYKHIHFEKVNKKNRYTNKYRLPVFIKMTL